MIGAERGWRIRRLGEKEKETVSGNMVGGMIGRLKGGSCKRKGKRL